MAEKLNEEESTVNIAELIVGMDQIRADDSPTDGYDRYYIVDCGWRQVWCGRSAVFGTGPVVCADAHATHSLANTRVAKVVDEKDLPTSYTRRECLQHPTKPTPSSSSAAAAAQICTCHYSCCIVCYWGENLALLEGTGVPIGFTRSTIRQVLSAAGRPAVHSITSSNIASPL